MTSIFGFRTHFNYRSRRRDSAATAISKMPVPRRTLVLGLGAVAAASAVLGVKTARAQGGVWHEFRRDDLGFRIEMPGEPKIEVEDDDYKDIWIRTTDAEVKLANMLLGAHCTEWKDVQSPEQQFGHFREGMRAAGVSVTREVPMTMNGFPAREFIREAEDLNYIHRLVVMEKLTIGVSAHGERGMHSDPIVRRFFDSFRLLRSAR